MKTITPSLRADRLAGFFEPATVVLFAGLGGSCIGIEDAYTAGGYRDKYVDLCVNHWEVAVRVHELNHPMTQHLHSDVWEVDPAKVLPGRRIAYLHASPDCTDFSKAKGGMPKRKYIRALADVVIVWGKKRRPDVITLENVEEFLDWGPLMHKRHSKRLWCWIKRRAGKDKPAVTVYGPNMAHADAADWIERHESAGWSIEPWLMPDPAKRGQEFRRWKGELEALGYVVEAKEMRACDHGTPTTRNRLYVIARCDGKPIIFREPTHGRIKNGRHSTSDPISLETADAPRRAKVAASGRDISVLVAGNDDHRLGLDASRMAGLGVGRSHRASGVEGQRNSDAGTGAGSQGLKPYRTAAECIDWSQPMLSIFATRPEARAWAKSVNVGRDKHDRVGVPQRPLKLKTNQRLAGGLLKHTLEAADPFILNIENYGWKSATRSTGEPLSTVTANPKGGKHAVVDVQTAGFTGIFNHGGHDYRTNDPREPMNTVTGARDARGAVGVSFTAGVGGRAGQSPATSIDAPMPTVTGKADRIVAGVETLAAYSIPRYGERAGQDPRSQSLQVPAAAVTGTGNGTNLVAVSLTQENHTDTGSPVGSPLRTVVGGTVHPGLLLAHLTTYHGAKGDEVRGQSPDQPIATLDTQNRYGAVAAHVMKFRGESPGTAANEPIDTIIAGGASKRDAGAAHAMGTAVAYLTHMYTSNTCGGQGDPNYPAKTITSGGQHGAVSVVYLSPYYGEGSGLTGHSPAEPMPTVVSKDRLAMAAVESTPPGPHWVFTQKGLARAKQVAKWAIKHLKKKVEKHLLWVRDEAGKKFALLKLSLKGAIHIVTDIAMRMLRPRELARAQGFSDSYVIDRTVDGQWVKKADQVKLIGNSVCRQVMAAIAYDNVVLQGVLGDRPARKAVRA